MALFYNKIPLNNVQDSAISNQEKTNQNDCALHNSMIKLQNKTNKKKNIFGHDTSLIAKVQNTLPGIC